MLSKGGPIIGVIFHHDNDVRHAINDIAENKSTNEIYQMNAQKLLGAASAQEKDNIRTYLSGLMKSFKTYSIVEASDSFFAYRPVLESIRSMISVPLAKELVHLQDTEPRPDYLPRIVKLPSMFNNMECDLDNWCNTSIIENTSLDISQSTAVHLALTSRVGLIQGPPGMFIYGTCVLIQACLGILFFLTSALLIFTVAPKQERERHSLEASSLRSSDKILTSLFCVSGKC